MKTRCDPFHEISTSIHYYSFQTLPSQTSHHMIKVLKSKVIPHDNEKIPSNSEGVQNRLDHLQTCKEETAGIINYFTPGHQYVGDFPGPLYGHGLNVFLRECPSLGCQSLQIIM